MECFTFILMGGTTEQIEVLLLAQDGESAMQGELIGTFRHFDARKATCFLLEGHRKTPRNDRRSVEGYEPLAPPLTSTVGAATDHLPGYI